METYLTTKNFWEKGYEQTNFHLSPMPRNYPIIKELYKTFGSFKDKSVVEIGCFPGRFLYHFGALGFEVNGIDQTDHLPELINWFKGNNFKLGKFIQEDIFNIDPATSPKYDVVFSSGFIEHFTNFDKVVALHAKLVKDGGYVFITAPNFAGCVQRKLHSSLDSEMFNTCYLPAMDLEKWKTILTKEGLEIIDYKYIGGFDFWVCPQPYPLYKKILIKMIRVFMPMRYVPNSKHYSPEMFIVAKKK